MTGAEKFSTEAYTPGRRDLTLIFRLGAERFGLPLPAIMEVFESPVVVYPIPGRSNRVRGILNHHGQVIPLFNAAALLEAHGGGASGPVILLQLAGEPVGWQVDQIECLEVVQAEGPIVDGRRRAWYRGALLTLIDPSLFGESVVQQLSRT
jgi:Chemotaxis signal transduction protein